MFEPKNSFGHLFEGYSDIGHKYDNYEVQNEYQSYKELVIAIVIQAVTDYKKLCKIKNKAIRLGKTTEESLVEGQLKSIRNFFKSNYCKMLLSYTDIEIDMSSDKFFDTLEETSESDKKYKVRHARYIDSNRKSA